MNFRYIFYISLLGLKTIHCFINGNCYKEVWYFILIYIFVNILFVGFQMNLKKKLPKLSKNRKQSKKR